MNSPEVQTYFEAIGLDVWDVPWRQCGAEKLVSLEKPGVQLHVSALSGGAYLHHIQTHLGCRV